MSEKFVRKLSSKVYCAINNGSHKDSDDSDYLPDDHHNDLIVLNKSINKPASRVKVKGRKRTKLNNNIDKRNDVDLSVELNVGYDKKINSKKSVPKNLTPPIGPIKMKKNFQSKHKSNWAIVSDDGSDDDDKDDDDDDDDDIGFKKKRKKRQKKTKKVTFNVTDVNENKKYKRSMKKLLSYDNDDANDNSECINGVMHNKPVGVYYFNRLTKPMDTDFDQILPDDILVQIIERTLLMENQRMKAMINLSQVSEHWRRLITSTPLLWKQLDLRDYPDDYSEKCLYELCDSHLLNFVSELNLSGWSNIHASRVLSRLASDASDHLKVISLKNCTHISSNFLSILSQQCPNLESLDISGVTKGTHASGASSAFSAAVWRPFLEKSGAKLTALYMAENSVLTFANCISAIMEFCPNLQILDLSNVESINKTSTISIEKLQNSCPKLRILRAANVTIATTAGHSSSGFTQLEELSIPVNESNITGIAASLTDSVFEQLTKSAEKLKLIDIRGSRLLTPRALVKIPSWSVQYFVISNCPNLYSDQLALVFSKWSSSLIDVDLSWNISEKSIVSCLKELCESGNESQLKSIQLRGSAVPFEDLKKLMKSCNKLESIDLQSCRGLPRGIKRAFSGDEFLTLRNEIILGRYD